MPAANGCCSRSRDQKADATYQTVQDYYGRILNSSKDLKTSACTAGGRPHQKILRIMQQIPDAVSDKFYGCGAPLPLGIEGLSVLDLGSGSGRDCYVCAALVGSTGSVLGIDMTEEQVQVAREHAGAFCTQLGYSRPNMRFIKGHIEYLDKAGVPDATFHLVISNCVVNLSPDKARVLREAYRVLAPGGEFYFSDVYCDRRLPEHVRAHQVLWGECISGALYIEDFRRLAGAAGFTDPRVLASAPVEIQDPELHDIVGNARFFSITYRLFKLPGLLESTHEDYGQVATYKGTIPGHAHAYALDREHYLEAGRPVRVCGNTAAMLGERGMSWLAKYFEVSGDRDCHFGLFTATALATHPPPQQTSVPPGGCC